MFDNLNTPRSAEERQPSKPVNPWALGIASYILSDIIAGPETTLLDRAVFIAYPYAIAAAATFGAEAGLKHYNESMEMHRELEEDYGDWSG